MDTEFAAYKKRIHNSISSMRVALKRAIMGTDGIVKADQVMSACMPQSSNFDVFISHSHADVKRAQKLADCLLFNYGLSCFIDSNYWLHSENEIQRPLDDIVKNPSEKYLYSDILKTTSHVHAMLSMSLMKMMDSCECCIFINPERNDSPLSYINSPWIYEEITMFNYLGKRKPNRLRQVTESFSAIPRIIYKCDFSNWKELSLADFKDAKEGHDWLDRLYEG